MIRTNLTDAARLARTSNAVGTPRKADDKHLVQQIKELDTFHSHTATNVEYRQPAGHTAVVLDQFEDTSAPSQQKSSGGGSNKTGEPNQAGEWNHNQPRGKSAEAVVTYISSQQSHPVVTIMDDRRVRPYAMKPGEAAHYATSGTGQMLFHNNDGSYLVSVNNPSEEKNAQEKERMASLRHVNKSKQKREIRENEQVPEHPHQGETVNTEVRVTKNRIELRAGDTLVGHYDKPSNTWELYESGGVGRVIITPSKVVGQFGGNSKSFRVDATHTHIKFGSNAIFVDEGGCWSTVPIELKADPCS